jgi:hypothetical protein
MYIGIEVDNDVLDVQIYYKMTKENDSIGKYDYCGTTYNDNQEDHWVLESFDWMKHLYTDEVNELIQKYIDEHLEELIKEAQNDWEHYNN